MKKKHTKKAARKERELPAEQTKHVQGGFVTVPGYHPGTKRETRKAS